MTLVGAGCGPDLITVLGLRALQSADVILYDDLLDAPLLSDPSLAGIPTVYVGKRSGAHSADQSEINERLIALAKEGKRVVRLKGGDSFVFGRGGEEILALQEAGIPVDVIPSVSSAIAVPEHLGVPVTHRGVAQSFTVVTGHSADGTTENYEALAGLEGTLVFLMGLRSLDTICGKLLEHGKAPDTPACVLSRGYRENETRIDGTLSTIADLAKDAETPGILVVGSTAGMHLESTGPSVSVLGTQDFCDRFRAKCPGAVPYPILQLLPNEAPLPDLADYEWLCFMSASALRFFFDKVEDLRALGPCRLACVGTATEEALNNRGFRADFVPSKFDRATLKQELPGSGKALLIGAAGTVEASAPDDRFHALGLYESTCAEEPVSIHTKYLVFASGNGVRGFYEHGGALNGAVPVCIGTSTAKALAPYDDRRYIAAEHTIDGILAEIARLEADETGEEL